MFANHTQIPLGSTVRVVRSVLPSDGPLRRAKKDWTLVRYSEPHGYAVLEGHGETWHVHPESLAAVLPRHLGSGKAAAEACNGTESCVWTEYCACWQASCSPDRAFQFNEDGPEQNHFSHCPYCGRTLVAIPADEEDKR